MDNSAGDYTPLPGHSCIAIEWVFWRPSRRDGSAPPVSQAGHLTTIQSLSDVAVMNTVTRGPETSPRTPHISHNSSSSWVDHHVECGTNPVTRAARRRDWEGLSGRRQFSSKDPKTSLKEGVLFAIRSVSARNSRMESSTGGSEI